jgi:hypothetical protein
MSSSEPPRFNPDGTLSSVFNVNDYKQSKGYVTFEDLLSYANLYTTNIFRGFNRFTSIQIIGTINSINAEYLQYIQYIPNIIFSLTDISYDEQTDTTIIENNLKANKIECDEVNGFNSFQFLQGLSENIQNALDALRLSISNILNRMIGIDDKILILDNDKANKSDVDNEILILKNGKADITFLNSRITTLKNEILGGASSAYDTLLEIQNILQDNAITDELLTLINQKANQTSLNTTNTNVSTLSDNIINLQDLKADITFVNNSISTLKTELSNNITSLQNGKADITFVNNTTTTLKNELTTDIINLQAVKADISFVNNKITTLKSEILGGASSAYDTLLEIQQFLQNDASHIQALINLVSQKANQSSF